jgi:hypothetical protein
MLFLVKLRRRNKEERLKHKLERIEKDKREKEEQRHIHEREQLLHELKLRELERQKKTAPVTEIPDVIEEQTEPDYTTLHCPQSEKDLKKVSKNPENYLEINIVKKSRVVDTFPIPVDLKSFTYKKKKYDVDEDCIYLLPTKNNLLIPTSFYHENKNKPTGFKNTNKGITGKALSLLYMEQLYTSLLYAEDNKYNLFIVILLIACLIAFGVGCYFVFTGGGAGSTPLNPIGGGGNPYGG